MLAGCGSIQKPAFKPVNPNTFAETVYLPALGQITTANIGEALISTKRVAAVPALVLKRDEHIDTPYDKTYLFRYTLKSGKFHLVATDADGGRYFGTATAQPALYKSTDPAVPDSPHPDHFSGIHISAKGVVSLFVLWQGTRAPAELIAVPRIDFEKSTADFELPGEHLQKELIYTGVSQGQISIRYREFWKGVSRPDFSQDVKYDLAQGRDIGFRDARFEVIDASNTSITYRTSVHLK